MPAPSLEPGRSCTNPGSGQTQTPKGVKAATQLGSPETQWCQRPGRRHVCCLRTEVGREAGRLAACGVVGAATLGGPMGPVAAMGLLLAQGLWSLPWVPSGCSAGMGPREAPVGACPGGRRGPLGAGVTQVGLGVLPLLGPGADSAWGHRIASPGAAGAPPNCRASGRLRGLVPRGAPVALAKGRR